MNLKSIHTNPKNPRLIKDERFKKLCKSTSWAGFAQTIHPIENRDITIEEAKRFCSFPDNYTLIGNYSEQWNRLGNAVMPKMMYHIAKYIKENILSV